jgi:uncharacterized protein (TIGR02265 family)
MFIDSCLKSLERSGMTPKVANRYVTFKDYPLVELMNLLLEATAQLHPELPPREGLRQLGRLVYPTLVSSTGGKVIFSLAGNNFEAALPLSRKAYEISLKPGSVRVEKQGPGRATMVLRDIWNFADSYQVGVFEGAMESFLVEGTVRVVSKPRACDVDLLLNWE